MVCEKMKIFSFFFFFLHSFFPFFLLNTLFPQTARFGAPNMEFYHISKGKMDDVIWDLVEYNAAGAFTVSVEWKKKMGTSRNRFRTHFFFFFIAFFCFCFVLFCFVLFCFLF